MNASTKEGSASVELQAILDNQRAAFKAEGPVAHVTATYSIPPER